MVETIKTPTGFYQPDAGWDSTLSELINLFERSPSVAAARQRRAERCNPFRINRFHHRLVSGCHGPLLSFVSLLTLPRAQRRGLREEMGLTFSF
jgi:hypothetical protein